jgi:serine/threonine protein kinase
LTGNDTPNDRTVNALAPQRRVGSFILLEKLGSGGVGEVWKARDHRLNRVVALKFILAESSRSSPSLAHEARAASALNHPNIVTILEIGDSGGSTYIAMEFVEGETLRAQMERSRLPLDTVIDIVTQMARGLAAAHQSGIVHRDVKPENVMVRVDGYVKLVDFGLAKFLPWSSGLIDRSSTDPTSSGVIAGTFSYMSPEQARGRQIEPSSDIFSFGIVLYELLTGEHPFLADNPLDTLHRIVSAEPVNIRERCPDLPPAIHDVVDRCLKKDKTQRFQTAGELETPLRLSPSPAPAPSVPETRLWKGIGLLIITLLGILIWRWAAPGLRNSGSAGVHSIAVMNFVAPPQDAVAGAMAQGLSEKLGGVLTREGFLVAARSRVLALTGETDARNLGTRLEVDAVLDGRLTGIDGTSYSIYVELIDTKKGFQIWSNSMPLTVNELGHELESATDIAKQIHNAAGGR